MTTPRRRPTAPGPGRRARTPRHGAALFGVLALLATLSAGQWLVLEQHALARQRDREAQLLFVGEQYRRALASYARMTPAGAPAQPLRLDELLEDRRFPRPVRHLRQLWPDPFTGAADWQLITVGGRIVGLHSRAQVVPMRRRLPGQAGPARPDAVRTVADWRFVHVGAAGR